MPDFYLNMPDLEASIRRWLEEDVGSGDITTMTTIPLDHQSKGILHVKEQGVLAGIPVAAAVFRVVDPALAFTPLSNDGDVISQGTIVAQVEGSTRSILLGERLALNLLQRLSGVATRTRQFAAALAGLPTRVTDTRKTTPGHRMLEKYAVRVGGGNNHRFGLFDAVMIKDNHIKGSGGITEAVSSARSQIPHTMKIEVEVENLRQLEEALEAGADIIMLDNMQLNVMHQAVCIVKQKAPYIHVEASGNVTLASIRDIAQTGVDFISVGRLTYSIEALDMSLDLNERKIQP